ncbi:MAG TPA: DNA-formamidopyrimidine glycosylase family protein [Thermoanaerobaculia bacterium]|jgi:formamidopyrimidine-DNA glycosylase|nr:DNA-formamidopyrimidine glycosylase family protein [Thermoanaerobaculia bacterium]
MPELPEVEIYCRYFAQHALQQKIERVRVQDERVLGDVRKQRLITALRGREFSRVRRHGKHLFADASSVWLHLHFGMTGDLAFYRDVDPRFARVIFDFTNGAHLAFEDMRLFGVVDLTRDPDVYIAEHHLGPDPLALTPRQFRDLLAPRRGAIKSLLMSQNVIAGIGNLYADETLFQASIHPRRAVDRLAPDDVRNIFMAMRRILREVIARKTDYASYPPRYLIHHREEGTRCPRCGGTIRRSVVFGRTTYFCAKHQR